MKNSYFDKEGFIQFCNEKLGNDMVNEEIIAGACKVTVVTVRNWEDRTVGSLPKVADINKLVQLAGTDHNTFFEKFIKEAQEVAK